MVWPSGEEGETRKNSLHTLLTDFKPSVSPATEYLVGQWAPQATDVFVDDGDVTTDKKLGLERFQVSVATKQLCLL